MASGVITLLYGRGAGGVPVLEPRPAVESPGAPAVPVEREGVGDGVGAGVEGFVDARAQPDSASAARMTFLLTMNCAGERGGGANTHVLYNILICCTRQRWNLLTGLEQLLFLRHSREHQ